MNYLQDIPSQIPLDLQGPHLALLYHVAHVYTAQLLGKVNSEWVYIVTS